MYTKNDNPCIIIKSCFIKKIKKETFMNLGFTFYEKSTVILFNFEIQLKSKATNEQQIRV